MGSNQPRLVKSWQKAFKRKRYSLLLEVMIAFALIILCALPMIYPHVYMLTKEKQFSREIELDRSVDLIFAEVLEKLYKNDLPWDDFTAKKVHGITSSLLNKVKYRGQYVISIGKNKPTKTPGQTLNLLNLEITLYPEELGSLSEAQRKKKAKTYKYDIFVDRSLKQDEVGGHKNADVNPTRTTTGER